MPCEQRKLSYGLQIPDNVVDVTSQILQHLVSIEQCICQIAFMHQKLQPHFRRKCIWRKILVASSLELQMPFQQRLIRPACWERGEVLAKFHLTWLYPCTVTNLAPMLSALIFLSQAWSSRNDAFFTFRESRTNIFLSLRSQVCARLRAVELCDEGTNIFEDCGSPTTFWASLFLDCSI